jgi:hypothetical protein
MQRLKLRVDGATLYNDSVLPYKVGTSQKH